MSDTMEEAPQEGRQMDAECAECGQEAHFFIPAEYAAAVVVFEPSCGHRNEVDNPFAPPAEEAAAPAEGETLVADGEAGTGASASQ